jgi:hypothetical protein
MLLRVLYLLPHNVSLFVQILSSAKCFVKRCYVKQESRRECPVALEEKVSSARASIRNRRDIHARTPPGTHAYLRSRYSRDPHRHSGRADWD